MKLSARGLEVKGSSTLAISAKAKALKKSGVDIVNFTAGEPDFDTPSYICDAARKAIDDGFTKYTPSSGIPELREAVCAKLKTDNGLIYKPSQIVISNGAKQCLFNAFCALLDPGDEVILPAPYWLSYYEMIKLCGGVPVIVYALPENGWKIGENDLRGALTNKTKVIVINSPSNPTGAVYTKDELSKVAAFACEHDLAVISDEIYENLIYSDQMPHVSIASLNDDIFKRTIVINGLSKSYSMTGWRIGYSACSAEIAEVIDNIQSNSTANINSIAQKAAISALTEQSGSVADMRREFARRRDYMVERIGKISCFDAVKPEGAFYVFACIDKLYGKTISGTKINNSEDLCDVLLTECNVALIPGTDFGYQNYVRFSFSTSREEIEKGMNRLEKLLLTV